MFTVFAECETQVLNHIHCMEAEMGDKIEEQKHANRFQVGRLKY